MVGEICGGDIGRAMTVRLLTLPSIEIVIGCGDWLRPIIFSASECVEATNCGVCGGAPPAAMGKPLHARLTGLMPLCAK